MINKVAKKENFLSYLLLISLFVISVLILLFQTFNQNLQGDENEHLYNSYMIFLKKVPYRDFFEHHNPLLWYLISPLYIFFENNEKIYYIVRFLMFLSVILTAFYIYKISEILNIKKFYCTLASLIYLCFDINLLTGIQLRPDTPMTLFLTSGLYYFIKYLKTYKNNNLNICFLNFIIAFWFLQKALFLFLPIIFFIFYKIITRKILLTDFLSAIFIPALISFFYILYLYKNDAFSTYYYYNIIGNTYISQITPLLKISEIKSLQLIFIANFLALIFFYKQKDVILLVIFNLIITLLTLYLLPAHAIHYLLPLLPITAILYTMIFQKLLKNKFLINFFILTFFIFYINLFINIKKENSFPLSNSIKINKFITQNTSKDDEVFANTNITGIKKQSKGYYYFGPQDIVELMYKIFPYKKLISDDIVIINEKPKIIYKNNDFSLNINSFINKNYREIKLHNPSIIFYVRKD